MLEKLRNPRARKHFLAWCVLAIFSSAIANYYLNRVLKPQYDKSCSPITVTKVAEPSSAQALPATQLDNCSQWTAFLIDIGPDVTVQFISASLTALFFLALLSLVREDEEALKDIEILFQPDQKKRHFEAIQRATFWHHDGHLANWVRTHVIPTFLTRSQDDMAVRRVKAAILDPTHSQVCTTYLEHIRGLPKDEQRFRDIKTLQAELCATVYTFAQNWKPGHLVLELFLKQRIDFIRDDISDLCAFWTTVGKNPPAIALYNRNNKFLYYNLAQKNFETALASYTRIDIEAAAKAAQENATDTLAGRISNVMRAVFPNQSDFHTPEFSARVEHRLNGQ